MKAIVRTLQGSLAIVVIAGVLLVSQAPAQSSNFHSAPESAKALKNPYQGQPTPHAKALFHLRCARCHGENGEGSGNIPALKAEKIKEVTPGEIFWFITKGDVNNGMPSWATLPKATTLADRELRANARATAELHRPAARPAAPMAAVKLNAPPPKPPFTDFRYEKPGEIRKITVKDLPAPFATSSAGNSPKVVARPEGAWPQVPAGFKVEQYATGLDNPRIIRTAPNGDIFVAETESRRRQGLPRNHQQWQARTGVDVRQRPERALRHQFLSAQARIQQWVYIGNTDSVVRFPYQNGDMQARGPAQHIADVPGGRRPFDARYSVLARRQENVCLRGLGLERRRPGYYTPAEKNRADVLEFNPDGTGMRIFAYGIRNCVGLATNPKTGELWCSVNERDGLGDNLVPDYITHVQDGGFYGWPWWYMGSHQDPRHKGKHPELKDKAIVPDVLLNPHNASLGITFYDGKQFPAEYQGDLFGAEHGSWNRAVRVGYELIRVPLHQTGHASGEYQDFMTGFVIDNEHVWGRPVSVTVAPDGSLLVTDDGGDCIWRISYTGK